jgi:DNA topoisomerase IB
MSPVLGRPGRQGRLKLATDRVRAVRLRRSDVTRAGIRRLRSGRGFRYLGAGDQPVPPEELARIKNLVIPPAWQEVWICPWPNGHIQAVGFDAAGRRQYLYHPRWREKRDQEKHDHVLEFAAALPDARKIVTAELAGRGLSRERVLAAAVRLLDLGFFRVGGERYAEDNGTYGLATLQRDHVRFSGGQIVFNYLAKGSFERVQAVADPQVCQVIRSLKARRPGGDALFAYYRQGQWHQVHRGESAAQVRQPPGRGGDPFVGRGQRHPHVPAAGRPVELAGRDQDAALGGQQLRRRPAVVRRVGDPQVEPGLGVVDGPAGRNERRPQH